VERVEAALDRPGFGGFHGDGQTPGRHGVRPDKTEAKAKLREVMRTTRTGFRPNARWCCPLPLHRLGWAVRVLSGSLLGLA
jgi:hypothetical protein